MRSTSGYASIWCIFFHQLQPRDSMAPITRGLPNETLCVLLHQSNAIADIDIFIEENYAYLIDALIQFILILFCQPYIWVLSKHLSVIEKLSLKGFISLGFAQTMIHYFKNTVLNS